ncbi:MAG: class I SAM-dependent methyltransferase [Cryomorphaceae bacterium]|nr:class I SAM-dependent methyltransferase [Cryomorphaceae bacterium]
MADWNGGYVTDINYTFGYQMELNPLNATFALLSSGYVPPALGTHCELGFGQGISVNIHAAASGSEWYGTDFNPAQVAFAKELANVSGSSIHLYDESFEEFCARSD